ncbi:amidohydrolase family protein [Nodosilinea sp. LEGE 07088]|uniref:amidohydrolase family protein n=1 Tax=Nodosilinea sp. LEGE 07088 TaxID=2777968 RepID=UPI001880EB1C|nr:amidohydrolase family protein [Nodosilinea sp. LEGE 07088]MBE9140956.1 amidohydrolase family protein [Nodosilinea sp. LEGE 07088]
MPNHLQITNTHLPDRDGLWCLSLAEGKIAEITPVPPIRSTPDNTLDAQGQLLIPGLVDGHIHLDKARLLARQPAQVGTFAEALAVTLRLKQGFTVADIQTRARQVVESAIGFGITAMRSHVEVDPTAGLRAMEALLPLRQEYAWGITLQLAVFAQEGITQQPKTLPLLRQAMAMGGDVIGSAPYVDADPQRNVQHVFDLAQEFDCDVDFHLDFLDDNEPLLLPFVIAETQRRGWQGRVCLGHMTKLAALPPTELADLATALRETQISILALPASDLYMMARQETHNQRRGVAPIHRLAAQGVNVGLATNNILNLFTPFGDGDVLKICTLLAQVLQLGTTASHQLCLAMATTQAAQAIGIADQGLKVGDRADLVLLDATSVSEAVGAAPSGRTVIKAGQIVARRQLQQAWFPPVS